MKPYQILLFILLLFIVLLIPSFFIVDSNNSIIRYPSFNQLLSIFLDNNLQDVNTTESIGPDSTDYGIASAIDEANSTPILNDIHTDTIAIDTIVIAQTRTIPLPKDNTNTIIPIEYGNNPNALDAFFDALYNNEHKTEQVRVMHFADSQVEGDMITSAIRQTLQDKFGGSGVGFLPACTRKPLPKSVKQSSSNGWSFHSIKYDNDIDVNHYGILGGLSKIADASKGETVSFSKTGNWNRNMDYNRLRICLGNNPQPYTLSINIDGLPTDTFTIEPNQNLNTIIVNTPTSSNNIEIELFGEDQLLVYGISQETKHGIFVDNIPVRGSAGTFFTKIDVDFAHQFLSQISTKLILVHYGINVVPNDNANFKYYENTMTSQLKAIKAIKNDASIILIGVSDMSQNSINGYQSNPNVLRVLNAQQNAAKRAGVAFWNCYKAMGGNNSMTAWATAKPALAQKDFIHFNHRGGRIIAKLFTNSLLNEYSKYMNKNAKHPITSTNINE